MKNKGSDVSPQELPPFGQNLGFDGVSDWQEGEKVNEQRVGQCGEWVDDGSFPYPATTPRPSVGKVHWSVSFFQRIARR